MESRRGALALQPQPGVGDRREKFVGRYANRMGWAIVRRRLDGGYEIIAAAAGPNGRWMCDLFADIGKVNRRNVAGAEAGEEGESDPALPGKPKESDPTQPGEPKESYPVHLEMKGSSLVLSEERPLAGHLCGHNGFLEGTYRRVPKVP